MKAVILSIIIFSSIKLVAVLPENSLSIVSSEVMDGRKKRNARRKLERMGK